MNAPDSSDARRRTPDQTDDFWACPRCGEAIERQFGACWKCGATVDGRRLRRFTPEAGDDLVLHDETPPDERDARLDRIRRTLFWAVVFVWLIAPPGLITLGVTGVMPWTPAVRAIIVDIWLIIAGATTLAWFIAMLRRER